MIERLLPGLAALQNVHPMFVHFPIAFFLGALVMEGGAVFRDEKFHIVATWMIYLGTLAAIITLSTGFIAADTIAAADPGGHSSPGHEYIHLHRNWMATLTIFSGALSLYLFRINRKGKWASQKFGLLLGLLILSSMITLGADRGARLVYEFGVGVNPKAFEKTPAAPKTGHDHPETFLKNKKEFSLI
ncbi:MAG: DUF2231 domain-containing protein [Nitrospirae bacterium]|nr:DUF2231 domain-containing protein [Nitrospirota bacterium]MBI3351980.1 DUF2231 domain-containing protein [Nitrospirota bacterium]